MSKELLAERNKLADAYAKSNDAVTLALKKCAECKNDVVEFDEEHPAVMRAVANHFGEMKRAARQAERAEAEAEAEAEGGDA